jgi:hypothetical protein
LTHEPTGDLMASDIGPDGHAREAAACG